MIFLLNGPPGAGKDTAANALAKKYDGLVMKFAKPLKDGATAIYCNNDRALFDSFDTFEKKGQRDPQFHGESARNVQISLSEDYLKPKFGQTFFGKTLANSIRNIPFEDKGKHIFVSDSGFRPEAEVLVEQFGVENVTLIRLHREGHTYEGDSRGYIDLVDLGVKCYDITNTEGNIEQFIKDVEAVLNIGAPNETK